MTYGEVIGESEDELKKLVWLIEKEDGSDNTDESEGELCYSEDNDIIEEDEFSGISNIECETDEIFNYPSFPHHHHDDEDDHDVIDMTHVKQTMWATNHVVIDETEDKKSDEEAFIDAMDGRLERLIPTLMDSNILNKVNNKAKGEVENVTDTVKVKKTCENSKMKENDEYDKPHGDPGV